MMPMKPPPGTFTYASIMARRARRRRILNSVCLLVLVTGIILVFSVLLIVLTPVLPR